MIPLVVCVDDEGRETERFAFKKSPVRIGRSELNDLPLPRPFVSNYHGLIHFDELEAHYVDLGSTNGSMLDGVRLERNQPAQLVDSAEVIIGSLRLTFSRRMTAERPAVAMAPTTFSIRAAPPGGIPPVAASRPGAPPVGAAAGLPPEAARRIEALPLKLVAPPTVAAPPVSVERPAPSPQAPAPPAASLQDEAAAQAAIEAVSLDLDLSYASYRGTWDHLRNAIEGVVSGLSPPVRGAALKQLQARYQALAAEPQFVELCGGSAPAQPRPGPLAEPVPPPAPAAPVASPLVLDLPSVFTAGDGLGAEALRLLRAFGESYLPVEPALGTPQEIQQLLERAAGLLENFGRSFLELQRGYEEFGKEMGVRTVQPEGALYRARDARQVLSYLLDPRAAGRDRELQRAFADFMIHQVALLRGVAEGAQELLGELSPEAIEEAAPKSAWTGRAAALWKKYEERYHELADEEDAVTELLFGKQFARAYAALVGRRSTGDGDGKPVAAEDDDDPES